MNLAVLLADLAIAWITIVSFVMAVVWWARDDPRFERALAAALVGSLICAFMPVPS